jgi:Kef-type K+ transport system membrane component KefB
LVSSWFKTWWLSLFLTFLAGLGDPEALEPATMALDLGLAFLGMGAMLVLALLAARYLLVKPMSWVAASAEATLIWSLCWCFAFVVGSEWLNLSPEIGAFLAGLSLAQLPIAHNLRRRVHPLMNFFIAIFFIALGAQMELAAATEHWLAAIHLLSIRHLWQSLYLHDHYQQRRLQRTHLLYDQRYRGPNQ